jgi:radical SAM protein with 4Fe4S-binding SPASM domain
MTVVAGNVREQSFSEIWQTSPVLQQLRDVKQLKGRCGSCEYNELCGGCRCRAYAAFGDYLQEDPACTYQPSGQPLQFEKMTWSAEAQTRLERIPIAFIRNKVRQGVETYAQRKSIRMITPELMSEAVANEGRAQAFGRTSEFLPQTNHGEAKR